MIKSRKVEGSNLSEVNYITIEVNAVSMQKKIEKIIHKIFEKNSIRCKLKAYWGSCRNHYRILARPDQFTDTRRKMSCQFVSQI